MWACYSDDVRGDDPKNKKDAEMAGRTKMATATEEIVEQTQTVDETTPTEEKAKRQRVDVDKLAAENPNEKITLAFHVPAAMRVQLRKNAEDAKVSEAQYCRDLLANAIGYSVPDEFNERKRRAGMSDEEKDKANEEKRQNLTNLLSLVQSNASSNPELAELLKANGIDISALPKPRGKRNKSKDGADSE